MGNATTSYIHLEILLPLTASKKMRLIAASQNLEFLIIIRQNLEIPIIVRRGNRGREVHPAHFEVDI